MPIEFHCTQCGQLLRVAESSAGKGARCPGCKAVMVVPAASASLSSGLSRPVSQPPPAPPPTAALQPASAQDDLFAYLKQAVTPNAPPPPQPAAYQQPGVLPDRPFADQSAAQPFGGQPAAGSNPYASPAIAYPTYQSHPGERPGLPWETKPPGLAAWWETSQLCLSDAESAFRRMRQYGGFGSPMLFAVFGLLLGFVGQTVWSLPAMMFQAFAGGAGANAPGNQLAGMGPMTQVLLNGLLFVVWATGGLFVSAAVNHTCLVLVGGARQGYETTYRVTAFTAGSIAWLNIV